MGSHPNMYNLDDSAYVVATKTRFPLKHGCTGTSGIGDEMWQEKGPLNMRGNKSDGTNWKYLGRIPTNKQEAER